MINVSANEIKKLTDIVNRAYELLYDLDSGQGYYGACWKTQSSSNMKKALKAIADELSNYIYPLLWDDPDKPLENAIAKNIDSIIKEFKRVSKRNIIVNAKNLNDTYQNAYSEMAEWIYKLSDISDGTDEEYIISSESIQESRRIGRGRRLMANRRLSKRPNRLVESFEISPSGMDRILTDNQKKKPVTAGMFGGLKKKGVQWLVNKVPNENMDNLKTEMAEKFSMICHKATGKIFYPYDKEFKAYLDTLSKSEVAEIYGNIVDENHVMEYLVGTLSEKMLDAGYNESAVALMTLAF